MNADALFDDYARYHRTRGNRICHAFGIPLVALGTLGLLSHLYLANFHLARLDGGIVLWVLFSLWTLRLMGTRALGFAGLSLALYFLAREIPIPALWVCLSLGWVLQFVGHQKFERNSPAFIDNIKHLAIGPVWILTRHSRGPRPSINS